MTDLNKLNLNGGADSASVETKFQHYSSAKQATKLICEDGRVINFINFQFITADAAFIDFLDREIEAGNASFSKGELMTAEEADPMSALKRRHIEEYKAAEAEKAKNAALGITPDMGDTKPKKEHVNIMGTTGVASGTSNSNTTSK